MRTTTALGLALAAATASADEPTDRSSAAPSAVATAAPAVSTAGDPTGDAALEAALRRSEQSRLELGLRSEVRAGQPDGSVAGSRLTQLELSPFVGVRVPLRAWTLAASYDPRLFIVLDQRPAAPGERTTSYLHRGRLTLDGSTSPRLRLFVNLRGAYGDNDFLPLSGIGAPVGSTGQPPPTPGSTPVAPTPAAGPGRLPSVRFLRYLDFDGSAGFVHDLAPRLQWIGSAGWAINGGGDVAARQTLPFQRGPKGALGLLWTASRNDTLGLSLSGNDVRFTTGAHATLVDLTSTWTRAWDRALGTDVTVGVGGFQDQVPARPEANVRAVDVRSAKPIGGLGVRHVFATRAFVWRNTLTVLASPLPDRLTGVVYERVSGYARSAVSPTERLTFEAIAGGATAIAGPQRDARVEGRVSYQVATELALSAGGRAAWLRGSDLLGPTTGTASVANTGFGWVAFLVVGTSLGAPLGGGSP